MSLFKWHHIVLLVVCLYLVVGTVLADPIWNHERLMANNMNRLVNTREVYAAHAGADELAIGILITPVLVVINLLRRI